MKIIAIFTFLSISLFGMNEELIKIYPNSVKKTARTIKPEVKTLPDRKIMPRKKVNPIKPKPMDPKRNDRYGGKKLIC